MKPILIIDPGHGGRDPGGGSNRHWIEKDMNLKISLYQYERYKQLGVPVVMTRNTDKTLTTDDRTRIVRNSGARYCHSNHINSGGGDGAEVIHSIYGGKDMAEEIASELELAGQNIRRIFTKVLPDDVKQDYYFMNRETGSVTTNIIEYGFADSRQDDERQLNESWKKYAEAVVKAFCDFIGYVYNHSGREDVLDTVIPHISKTKKLHLPESATSWRVYPLNVAPVVGNEKGFLNPAKFNGLTYEILGSPQTYVYIIQTRDFGKVQLYGHPKTGATIS
ncbi:N-acetylmuramoyl-L-alanine amidase family protein [Virgibacillus ndiopensis]|uniref:N-acetylmuramoyl-L-alanine amidase family protein n=1 Tax=Virgibacillus ndiopensis TaxID=2004408 RepID=UPI001FEAE020|nr:N-acetylmuramoyl-L-alanine amidase [Virgibacillus ndiopensis]